MTERSDTPRHYPPEIDARFWNIHFFRDTKDKWPVKLSHGTGVGRETLIYLIHRLIFLHWSSKASSWITQMLEHPNFHRKQSIAGSKTAIYYRRKWLFHSNVILWRLPFSIFSIFCDMDSQCSILHGFQHSARYPKGQPVQVPQFPDALSIPPYDLLKHQPEMHDWPRTDYERCFSQKM